MTGNQPEDAARPGSGRADWPDAIPAMKGLVTVAPPPCHRGCAGSTVSSSCRSTVV